MTGHERVARALKRQSVDQVPVYENFWGETLQGWRKAGHLSADELPEFHFGLDMHRAGFPNLKAYLDVDEKVIEETDETKLVRNANGAIQRVWKHKAGTPEHVDFEVKDRAVWEEQIKPRLLDETRLRDRIPFAAYREARQECRRRDMFFLADSLHVFEYMRALCGDEIMLMAMALDPEWILDMCQTYTELMIRSQELLFAEEGLPDGVWYAEDMGYKQKSFVSPAMYRELIQPWHRRTFDFNHSLGLTVIMHSCGYIEGLLPDVIDAGIDCLQALEVKAGMDLVRLKGLFGDSIAFMGGVDIRTLETNDPAKIEAELRAKLPPAMAGSGYVLHSDHSISSAVEYDTYRYFLDKGREIGTVAQG